MNSEKLIRAVNDSFYEAFNKQNLDLMTTIWSKEDIATCIHPGWPVLRGINDILESWNDIFDNTDHMEIRLSDVSICQSTGIAWVNCQENLFSINMSGVQTSKVFATNGYKLVGGEWKMALHHAAAIPADPLANQG